MLSVACLSIVVLCYCCLTEALLQGEGLACLCVPKWDTGLLLGSWGAGMSPKQERCRAVGRFWQCLPATCRAAVLVSQRKEHSIPLRCEIKLGLIHRPHIGFCTASGRTWSGVADSVPELASFGSQLWAESHSVTLVPCYVWTNRPCFTAWSFAWA